jgi:hypothetical protein
MALPRRAGGFLIDLDSTSIEGGQLIPESAEALKALTRKEIPYRVVTNTRSKPRSAILVDLNLENVPESSLSQLIREFPDPEYKPLVGFFTHCEPGRSLRTRETASFDPCQN